MKKLLCVLCVSALLLCSSSKSSSVAYAVLPVPQNITIQTLNMNYVLKWDWDPDQAPDTNHSVTFTVQYLAMFKLNKRKSKSKQNWTSLCETTPERVCDFSSAQLLYYGLWVLRLQAQSGQNVSSWAQTEFCPDKDAAIGPPSAVNVTPVQGLLQVVISDPLTITNSSMKDVIPDMYYFIEYWKKGSTPQESRNLTSANNLLIVPELENWTWYCVRVQSVYDYYNKRSVYSPTHCTKTDGQTPYWLIVLCFHVALLLTFGFLLCHFMCISKVVKLVRSTFFPSVQLPAHIQEFLSNPDSSDTPCLLSTEPELENRLDVLTPCLEVTEVPEIILDVHLPPETSQPSGRMYSRHSSCDSGVYSTEGSGTRPNELGEVKTENMGIKIQMEELDEGVEDEERGVSNQSKMRKALNWL